jgi:hypothetical protein
VRHHSLLRDWAFLRRREPALLGEAEDLVFRICQRFPATADPDYQRKLSALAGTPEFRRLKLCIGKLPERVRPRHPDSDMDVLIWAHRIGSKFVMRALAG